MLTLRMLTVSCNVNTSANGMTQQESHVVPNFYHLN